MNKTFTLISDLRLGWDAAADFCWSRRGNLASISDELDNSIVRDMSEDLNASFWIGLYDDVSSWRWSLDTTPTRFEQRWEETEPDNANSSEHCASVSKSSYWRDRDCSSVKLPFFCNSGEKSSTMFVSSSLSKTKHTHTHLQ